MFVCLLACLIARWLACLFVSVASRRCLIFATRPLGHLHMGLVLGSYGFCNLDKMHEVLLVWHELWLMHLGPRDTKIHESVLVSSGAPFKINSGDRHSPICCSCQGCEPGYHDPKLHERFLSVIQGQEPRTSLHKPV